MKKLVSLSAKRVKKESMCSQKKKQQKYKELLLKKSYWYLAMVRKMSCWGM